MTIADHENAGWRMSSGFDVIVCGSLHLDIVVRGPALPRIDETVVGSAWSQVCGGKGGNQAVQAAAAGARTAMIGRVGSDEFGRTLLANLKRSAVDHSRVAIDAHVGSGMSVAILQDDGDYGAVIVSGSNLKIDPASLKQHWQALGAAKVLVLQNEVPHAVNVAAARAAQATGAKIVFNAAPARDVAMDLLDLVDVLVVNRVEAEAMFGAPVRNRTSASDVLRKRRDGKAVVITLGGEGLVVGQGSNVVEIEPLPVKVTSTHGAGDCFVGTLAAQLAIGRGLIEACHAANMRAAEFVSRA
jgi:ribokinase